MAKPLPALGLLTAALLPFFACTGDSDLILGTTTSVQDSGLLEVLVPAFEKDTGYRLKPVAVGSGLALKLGERGEVDVLLVHSPQAEQEFMDAGFGVDRRSVMHNDFVVVGPAGDPARVEGLATAAEAFARIAARSSLFVSRGDDSGTHSREKQLWQQIDAQPFNESWYQESGQGMGQTLIIADNEDAYTLSDRGTYLALRKRIGLRVLVEGDPALQNPYHVIRVNPANHPGLAAEPAEAFADFLTSADGQEIIRTFGVDRYGEPLFVPDAFVAPTPSY